MERRYIESAAQMIPVTAYASVVLHIKRTGHNLPRELRTDWWVLTTANAAGTNGTKCIPKHGGARDNKFWLPIRLQTFANVA
jgi:hypothetical protein